MKRISHILLALLAAVAFASCSDDVSDTYSHERAFLKFYPVTGVVSLYTAAAENYGSWCTVRLGTNTFNFQGNDGTSATYPYSAEIKAYGTPQCVVGFVVGHSSVPDLNLQYPLMAYDLVCPSCYAYDLITPALQFTSQREELYCSRCKRTYDLTQNGIVKSGEAGEKLLRYRTAQYADAQNVLIIMN